MNSNFSDKPYASTSNSINTAAKIYSNNEPLKHSGVGIASFVLCLLNIIFFFALIIIAGIAKNHGAAHGSDIYMVVGTLIFLCAFVDLVCIGLGIASLCQKNRKKIFGILGFILSLLVALAFICLMSIGLSLYAKRHQNHSPYAAPSSLSGSQAGYVK